MSKIVQVANAMISNPQNISETAVCEGEFFFLYKNKYRWSIKRRDGVDVLYFYPGNPSNDTLFNATVNGDWDDIEIVHYSTESIGTAEARQTFSELYNLVKEKTYGIDSAFEDILSDLDLI